MARSGSGKLQPHRSRGRLAPVLRAKLAQDVAGVRLHRPWAEEQVAGNFAVGLAGTEEIENLPLAAREGDLRS